jgi:excisionase family DNA binding protein
MEVKNPELLDYDEAAAYLDIAPITLRRWVSDRRIDYIKMGSKVRFRPRMLDDFIEKSTVNSECKNAV